MTVYEDNGIGDITREQDRGVVETLKRNAAEAARHPRLTADTRARLETLQLSDIYLGAVLMAFGDDPELAAASGFDQLLAVDLSDLPVRERLEQLRADLREVAAKLTPPAPAPREPVELFHRA